MAVRIIPSYGSTPLTAGIAMTIGAALPIGAE